VNWWMSDPRIWRRLHEKEEQFVPVTPESPLGQLLKAESEKRSQTSDAMTTPDAASERKEG
jgi:hypothetical protein